MPLAKPVDVDGSPAAYCMAFAKFSATNEPYLSRARSAKGAVALASAVSADVGSIDPLGGFDRAAVRVRTHGINPSNTILVLSVLNRTGHHCATDGACSVSPGSQGMPSSSGDPRQSRSRFYLDKNFSACRTNAAVPCPIT